MLLHTVFRPTVQVLIIVGHLRLHLHHRQANVADVTVRENVKPVAEPAENMIMVRLALPVLRSTSRNVEYATAQEDAECVMEEEATKSVME